MESFFQSIQHGDLQTVDLLINQNPEMVNLSDENGLSALMNALYYREQKIADLLIEKGASINVFEACVAGRLEDLASIVNHTPEVANLFSPDGFQPLGYAAFFSHEPIVRFLLKHGAHINTHSNNEMRVFPINSAAASGNIKIMELLLENGANPNSEMAEGYTPLHTVAANGNEECIKLLLNFGANPTPRLKDGSLPIDLARKANHAQIVEILEKVITKE